MTTELSKTYAATMKIAKDQTNIDQLFASASHHIETARKQVRRSIDQEMVKAYFLIGRDVVEEAQQGQARARYGNFILQALSKALSQKYGRGFSVSTLKDIRQFYLTYKDYSISHALRGELVNPPTSMNPKKLEDATADKMLSTELSWIHYRSLMRISRVEARRFYEIEAIKNNWSGRELERQIGSLLFDRLSKAKDKDGLLELASKGHNIESPIDAIRDPMVLGFLNLPETHKLVESKLEEALITNLQQFFLELGRGFAFVSRQKRITLDGNHYYADLVFYHTILKCYTIVEIKSKPLAHSDLGQIQFYVNYFDAEVKMPEDNPSIGLVLCTDKSDAMVRYTLGDKAGQIFASKYQFHLPSIEELEQELRKEMREIEHYMKEHEE
jgi:predicted nuclease of restriction endonuclease-like (RecB) superfamily